MRVPLARDSISACSRPAAEHAGAHVDSGAGINKGLIAFDHDGHLLDWHSSGISVGKKACRVLTVDKVHGDPQVAFGLAPVVHADDVRMPQRRREGGFAVESSAVLRVGGQVCAKDFEGIPTRQARMLSEIHLTHAPRTEQSDDPEPGEDLTVS